MFGDADSIYHNHHNSQHNDLLWKCDLAFNCRDKRQNKEIETKESDEKETGGDKTVEIKDQ